MNILIKAAIIVDASTKHHLKKRDVLIVGVFLISKKPKISIDN